MVGLVLPSPSCIATKVGDYLKTPETPIWVVCSESHYSVIFCADRSIVSSVSSLTTATAAREQCKPGKTPYHIPNRTDATASIEIKASFRTTDGVANDRAVGGGRGGHLSGMASVGGMLGAYDRAWDGKPPQEEGGGFEAFDLEYYDGLGRQDEVSTNSDPQTLDGIPQVFVHPSDGLYKCTVVPPACASKTMVTSVCIIHGYRLAHDARSGAGGWLCHILSVC